MARSWKGAAFVAVLAASVVTNIVLYQSARRSADVERSAAPSRVKARAPVLIPLFALRPHPAAFDLESCRQQVDEILASLAEMKRQLQKLEPPREAFDHLAPDSAKNGALESELRRHVLRGDAGNDFLPEIECRGLICRVDRDTDSSTSPPLDPQWLQRKVRTAQGMRSNFYYQFHEPGDRPPGEDILKRFAADFERTGAVDRCVQRYREERVPEVRLLLLNDDDETEFDASGLSFRLSGALAGTQLGKCIADEMRGALQRVELPDQFQSASMSLRFAGDR